MAPTDAETNILISLKLFVKRSTPELSEKKVYYRSNSVMSGIIKSHSE
jgi:hypothetical protein